MGPKDQIAVLKVLKEIKRITKTIESDVLSNSEEDLAKNLENIRIISYKLTVIKGIFSSYNNEDF